MNGKWAALLILILMVGSLVPAQSAGASGSRADDEMVMLRVAVQDDMHTMNYLIAGDGWTWKVMGWVFDGLTWRNISDNDHVEPWAAEWFHHGPEGTWGEEPYPDNDNNTDYRNWTVKLREGIKWHDWESQTGDDRYVMGHDVVFSLRLAADVSRYAGGIDCVVARDSDGYIIYGRDINDKIPGGIYKGPNGDWDFGVDVSDQVNYPDLPVVLVTVADDGLTLHYTLMKTYADFSIDTLNALIVPERIWSNHIADKLTWEDPSALISFGQFSFDYWNYENGTSRVLTFRDYFRAERDPYTGQIEPYIDGIIFRRYGTTDAAVMDLTSYEVDYIAWAIDPGFIDTINADPHLNLVRNSDLGFSYLAFNMRKPEFGYAGYDPDDVPEGGIPTYDGNYTDVGKPFRQAFAHIIDKRTMVSKYLQGFGSVGTSVVSPVNAYWYNPNIRTYDYDPDKAREILDAQGWTDKDGDGWREIGGYKGDSEIDMLVPPNDYDLGIAPPSLLIQRDARNVGLNVRAIYVTFGTLVDRIERHSFDMYILGWSISGIEASARAPCDFFSSYNDGDGNNYVGYHNESFDRLCEEFMSEQDIGKRRAIGFKLQETIAEDVPYSVLYYRDVIEAYNDRFVGWFPRHRTIFNEYSIKNLIPNPCEGEIELSMTYPSRMIGGSTARLDLYVNNVGEPVPRADIRLTASSGELSSYTFKTDMNGTASVEYTAPEVEISTAVVITVELRDYSGHLLDSRTIRIHILPRPEIGIFIEGGPSVVQIRSGNHSTLEFRVFLSNGSMPDADNITYTYSIAPSGADIEFIGYDNGTWLFSINGTAPRGETRQYSLSITFVLMQYEEEVAADSSTTTLVVINPGDITPPPPPPPPPEEESNALLVAGIAIAAAIVIFLLALRYLK